MITYYWSFSSRDLDVKVSAGRISINYKVVSEAMGKYGQNGSRHLKDHEKLKTFRTYGVRSCMNLCLQPLAPLERCVLAWLCQSNNGISILGTLTSALNNCS